MEVDNNKIQVKKTKEIVCCGSSVPPLLLLPNEVILHIVRYLKTKEIVSSKYHLSHFSLKFISFKFL